MKFVSIIPLALTAFYAQAVSLECEPGTGGNCVDASDPGFACLFPEDVWNCSIANAANGDALNTVCEPTPPGVNNLCLPTTCCMLDFCMPCPGANLCLPSIDLAGCGDIAAPGEPNHECRSCECAVTEE